MKILNLEPTAGGYTGFCTSEFKTYHRFRVTYASHLLIPLKLPRQVSDYNAFKDLWSEVDPSVEFLQSPLEIEELTLDSLYRSRKNLLEN